VEFPLNQPLLVKLCWHPSCGLSSLLQWQDAVPFANLRHLETAFSQPSANSLQEIRLIAEGHMSLSEGILQSKPTADAFFACRFGCFGAGASIY